MSRQMFGRGAMLGDAGRWVAWAVLATWTQGSGFIHPTGATTDSVIVGDTAVATADHILDISGSATFNEQSADADCRIEGDTDANLIYTDAGNDYVGIGTSAPSTKLHVLKTGTTGLLAATTDFAVQDSGGSSTSCGAVIISGSAGVGYLNFTASSGGGTAGLSADMSTSELTVLSDTTKFDSGQKVKRTAVSGNYTVLTTDYYLGVDATSAVTLNLPTAASAGTGRVYMFVVETGSSDVTIDGNGSEKINNATTKVLTNQYETLTIVCTGLSGNEWIITAST